MDGTLWSFDGLDMMIHMLRNMEPKAPSGKQYNPHFQQFQEKCLPQKTNIDGYKDISSTKSTNYRKKIITFG